MEKKLYRKTSNKLIFGVCSGLADYFDLDPAIVRIGCVIVSILGGVGLWAYLIAAIVMPKDPQEP